MATRLRRWWDQLDGPRPSVAAAAGTVALARTARPPSGVSTPWGFGPPLAPFTVPDLLVSWDRSAAMSSPTISRARDLLVSAVSALPLTRWTADWSAVPAIEAQQPPTTWMIRPDPDRTRQWVIGWTVDDLLFYGVAHWEITDRYATTFPSKFRRLPPGSLQLDAEGQLWAEDGERPRRPVKARDVVEFLSPIEALLDNGFRAISIALQLDAAAERFAGTEVPAGVLEEQEGGEDLSPTQLAELADSFTRARLSNTTAATNKYVRYRESTYDASRMQLVEARTYQALELARLGNVPPYLVGAPAGTGMTYLNGQQARQDLIDFGAGPYLTCIEQTLSGPNVLPLNNSARFDLNVWLRNPFTTSPDGAASPNDLQIADQSTPPPQPPEAPG